MWQAGHHSKQAFQKLKCSRVSKYESGFETCLRCTEERQPIFLCFATSARTPSSLVPSPIRKSSTVSSHISSNSRKHIISCDAVISNSFSKRLPRLEIRFRTVAFLSAAKSGESWIKNPFMDSLKRTHPRSV